MLEVTRNVLDTQVKLSKSQLTATKATQKYWKKEGSVIEIPQVQIQLFSTVRIKSKTLDRMCMYTHSVKKLAVRILHNKD